MNEYSAMKNTSVLALIKLIFLSLLLSIALIIFLESESRYVLLSMIITIISLLFVFLRIKATLPFNQLIFLHEPKTIPVLITLTTLCITVYFHNTPFVLLMMCTVLLYATVCLGLTIQLGFIGIVNFAAAAFFGIGGYSSVILSHYPIPSLIIILLSGLISMLFSSLLIFPVLKTRGHYAALITIATGILFKNFLEVNDSLGGSQGLQTPSIHLLGFDFNNALSLGEIDVSFYVPYILLCLSVFITTYLITQRIEKSWFGLTLDIVRTDETAASTFGIAITKWKVTAFLFGNFIIGIAGSVYASVTGFIAPNNFTFSDSLIMISIIILGGIGNMRSIIPAALIMIIVPEKLQFIQEYRFLLYALLIIGVLLFRPNGLFPRPIRNFNQ